MGAEGEPQTAEAYPGMAGEGGQTEDDVLSEALETFDRGMGQAGTPGETGAAGSQGDQSGAAGAQAGESGSQSGAGGRTGTGAPAGTRAGSSGGSQADRAGSAGGGYRTDEERVAELDRELEGQMGTFDGMLLEERGEILASQETGDDAGDEDGAGGGAGGDDQEGSGAGGAGSDGSGTAGDFGGAGNEDGRGAPPLLGGAGGGGGMPNVRGGGGRQGDYEQVAVAAPVPQDIPTSDGDDVVARQLREAAMKEPDPVLREKLWNEYRRYKGLPTKE